MVYISADLKLKENDQRDQEIIKNWNSVIQREDLVLLSGIITTSKETKPIKEIFDQLSGQKRVIDINFKNKNEVERFKYITGTQPYQLSGFVPGRIYNKETIVELPVTKEQLKKAKQRKSYCAAAASLLQQEEVYQDKCLDISMEKWGDIPILYTDIPVLINNLLTYDEELRRN